MNQSNDSNPSRKRLRQTSILDFIPKSHKRINCSQQLDSEEMTSQTNSDLIVASTSALNRFSQINHNVSNGNVCQLNPNLREESLQITSHSIVHNTNESLSQTNGQSIDDNSTQMTDMSEIPETRELVISDDDDSEDETESLHKLNRIPDCLLPLPQLRPDSSHYVLYCVPLVRDCVPKPYPNSYIDKWDSRHVKMPNSTNNQITAVKVVEGFKTSNKVSKWELIEENLLLDFNSSNQLEEAIKKYNPFMKNHSFDVLHSLFNQNCEPEESNQFFDKLLPKLVTLALQLPSIVTQSIPLLKQNQNATLFLSQQQIACLLANAFFCTFPKRSQGNEEYKNYPIINFLGLFTSYGVSECLRTKVEKLKCIINYFRRILKETPNGVVSFERRSLSREEFPDWTNSNKQLKKLVVMKNGLIEKEGTGLLQVDFANKLVGGGVIGSGCVQEEIRFVICPELIVSRLFTEKLLDNEALIISGCEQFNTYSGYANTFCWKEDYVDSTVYDEWSRRCTRIAAIDALYFSYEKKNVQYEIKSVDRELNKAYCGFLDRRRCDPSNKCGIASGNWGCGAFNGDPNLKAVIQLMAASQADRDLVLFTFNDSNLKQELQRFYQFASINRLTVGHLYRALKLYGQARKNSNMQSSHLFKFIYDSKDTILESLK